MAARAYSSFSINLVEKTGFGQRLQKPGQREDIEAAASLFGAS
jgi:hypothetical protein